MENNKKINANANPKDKKYIDIINERNALQAVKEYKEDNNCSLKEAKDHIDKLRGIEPDSRKGGCMGIIVMLLAVSAATVYYFI